MRRRPRCGGEGRMRRCNGGYGGVEGLPCEE
ncbi:hypothetical protein Tco_1170460, partial [Tanacetum coccineum]